MNEKPRILVVDDDRSICRLLASILEMESYSFRTAASGAEAVRALDAEKFDIVFSDIYLGDHSGLDLLEWVKKTNADAEVVIMTAHGSMETAVRAVRHGAFDYISKPFELEEIVGVIHRIEEKIRLLHSAPGTQELAQPLRNTEIIGTGAKMVEIYKKVAKVAAIDAPVLVVGESGSGKELVARAVHANSPRSAGPFVVINCGALPENLLESELFGHEKGAFTGATGARKGLFESAASGTVFLDEISETSLGFQVKLLRVIQEKEVRRVGSNDTVAVDIRLMAATNRDLREMVRSGQFREDLFHRLNVFTLALPPLRERVEDIPLLVTFYLSQFGETYGKEMRISSEALELLRRYSWPGNVRELRNVLERALAFADAEMIQAGDLDFGEVQEGNVIALEPVNTLDDMERQHIIKILKETGGNKKRAAEILGIERRTLYNKAKRLGVDLGRI